MSVSQHVPKQVNQMRWQTRSARSRRRGAAVVELAITVPLLSLLALGVIEYSQLTHAAQVMSNASRRGASRAGSALTVFRSYLNDAFRSAR